MQPQVDRTSIKISKNLLNVNIWLTSDLMNLNNNAVTVKPLHYYWEWKYTDNQYLTKLKVTIHWFYWIDLGCLHFIELFCDIWNWLNWFEMFTFDWIDWNVYIWSNWFVMFTFDWIDLRCLHWIELICDV